MSLLGFPIKTGDVEAYRVFLREAFPDSLTDLDFYHVLQSSEGGHELYLAFVRIWTGFDAAKARQALEVFTSGNFSVDAPVYLDPQSVSDYMDSANFQSIKGWFAGIAYDGERAARTIRIIFFNFLEYLLDKRQ